MAKNKTTIYLPENIMKLLDELSDKTGMSKSSVLRTALLDYAKSLSLLTKIMHLES
jgi:metal-responsive CopG/Arc/MetJ family transcriptional regulator